MCLEGPLRPGKALESAKFYGKVKCSYGGPVDQFAWERAGMPWEGVATGGSRLRRNRGNYGRRPRLVGGR